MTVDRLNWPTLQRRPSVWNWNILANGQTWTSPLTGGSQTAEQPGARWWFRIGYGRAREVDWRVLDAFRAQLGGMAGRALLTPLHGESPRGVATGTPVVLGAGQTGRSLITTGWTANTALILRVGDYFSVPTDSGPELKILKADAASDADGHATLTFVPPLRNAPANSAALTVNNPVCPMRLVDNNQGEFALEAPRFGSVTMDFVESWL